MNEDRGRVTVGPASVGYRIATEALVFGGSTVTTTDIAVAAGAGKIGPQPEKAFTLDAALVKAAQSKIKVMLEETLDAMKTSPEPIPAYLVGGGAFLAPDELHGISQVVKLPHAGVANAIGAAIAQVCHPCKHTSSTVLTLQAGFWHRGCREGCLEYHNRRGISRGRTASHSSRYRSRCRPKDSHYYRQRKSANSLHSGQVQILRQGSWRMVRQGPR